MSRLSEKGVERLTEIAGRHGVSLEAAEHMLLAVMAGGGTQAQFNHPALGGMGQWSLGGMTMVGDMFNNALKAQVDALASDLSSLVRSEGGLRRPANQSQSQSQGGTTSVMGGGIVSGSSLFVPGAFQSANWWPEALGQPASVGSQNDLQYAVFPASRRLAINVAGKVAVYDTGDHQITGFSQQQGGGQSIALTSQHGLVRIADLKVIDAAAEASSVEPGRPHVADKPAPTADAPEPQVAAYKAPIETAPARKGAAASGQAGDDDIFGKIERLAALHAKGILTDKEFEAKKADLLDRL